MRQGLMDTPRRFPDLLFHDWSRYEGYGRIRRRLHRGAGSGTGRLERGNGVVRNHAQERTEAKMRALEARFVAQERTRAELEALKLQVAALTQAMHKLARDKNEGELAIR